MILVWFWFASSQQNVRLAPANLRTATLENRDRPILADLFPPFVCDSAPMTETPE